MIDIERKKIRVLSLTPELRFGGDENRMLGFGCSIDRERFDYEVATLNSPDFGSESRLGSLRARFVAEGIPLHHLGVTSREEKSHPLRPDHWIRKLFVVCRVVLRLRKLIREEKFDLLDTHGKDAIVIGSLVSQIQRIGTIATLYHTWSGVLASWFGKFVLGTYDRVVTDSDVRRQELDEWIVGGPKVDVICNGIHPPTTDRTHEEIKSELGLQHNEADVVFGQVARLVPFKGQVTLLRAARLVLDQFPNAYFLIVGFAPKFSGFRDELLKEANELGIADRVWIGGYGGPIADIWKLIDIHVHASHFDSLPNAILESMSLAKPAVVTNVGGITELVSHEKTGLVVPPDDVDALAQSMLRMMQNPQEADAFGLAARQRYVTSCHPSLVARQLEDVLETVVKKRKSTLPMSGCN